MMVLLCSDFAGPDCSLGFGKGQWEIRGFRDRRQGARCVYVEYKIQRRELIFQNVSIHSYLLILDNTDPVLAYLVSRVLLLLSLYFSLFVARSEKKKTPSLLPARPFSQTIVAFLLPRIWSNALAATTFPSCPQLGLGGGKKTHSLLRAKFRQKILAFCSPFISASPFRSLHPFLSITWFKKNRQVCSCHWLHLCLQIPYLPPPMNNVYG